MTGTSRSCSNDSIFHTEAALLHLTIDDLSSLDALGALHCEKRVAQSIGHALPLVQGWVQGRLYFFVVSPLWSKCCCKQWRGDESFRQKEQSQSVEDQTFSCKFPWKLWARIIITIRRTYMSANAYSFAEQVMSLSWRTFHCRSVQRWYGNNNSLEKQDYNGPNIRPRYFKASAAYMYQQCCIYFYFYLPQSRHNPDCTHDCILATVSQLLQSHACSQPLCTTVVTSAV